MIEKMKELSLLIDKASEIFYSGVDWKIKYDTIFTMGVGSKIIEAGFDFNWHDPDTSYEEDVTYYFRALQDFQKGMRLLYNERLKGVEMRPNNFPQASDFLEKVQANQESQRRRDAEAELVTIAKALENFDEKCNSDGVLRLGHNVIGRTIGQENYTTICDSGWKIGYDVEAGTWLFSIRGLSSPNEV